MKVYFNLSGNFWKWVDEIATKEVKNAGLNYKENFERCISQLKDLVRNEVVN